MSDSPAWLSFLLDVLADADVLVQVVRELALVEPVRLPVVDVADSQPLRIHFLSHSVLLYSFGVNVSVRWLVRLRIRVARPMRARAEALDGRALVGVDLFDDQVVADELVVVLRVRDRRVQELLEVAPPPPRGVCRSTARASSTELAADVLDHEPRLAGGRAYVLGLRAHDRSFRHQLSLFLSDPAWPRKVRVGANSPSL